MPRKALRSILPTPARLKEIRSLRILGDWIYASNLWHLNRYSASMAFFVGLFVAFIPTPGQMPIAALLAILLRCNLPLSVALVWVTNPVTMPPIYFMAYKVGALILQHPVGELRFELSMYWLTHSLGAIWKPFLLGCLICGLFFGCLGYFVINQLWRWHVVRQWRERKVRRAQRTRVNGPD